MVMLSYSCFDVIGLLLTLAGIGEEGLSVSILVILFLCFLCMKLLKYCFCYKGECMGSFGS